MKSLYSSVESFSGDVRLGLSVFLRAGAATAPKTAETRATKLDVSLTLESLLDNPN